MHLASIRRISTHSHDLPILINNPLLGPENPQMLDEQVKQFHSDYELDDLVEPDTLIRSGRLARDEQDYENIPGITNLERFAIKRSLNKNFLFQIRHLPKDFRVILAACCLAAMTQGWNQSNLSGANLLWTKAFNVDFDLANPFSGSSRNVWIFGAVVSASYFGAAAVGCWLSDPLNEYVGGRRGALFVAAVASFAACIGSAFTESWQALLATRIVTGIGMGAKASITPIFIAETAATPIRGTLLTSWQAMDAFGIMLGFAANLIVSSDWRKQMAAAFIPAVPLMILVPLCTESPRWLLKRGRIRDAYRSMLRLRESPILAGKDLLLMHAQLQAETKYFHRATAGDDKEAGRSRSLTSPNQLVLGSAYQQDVKRSKPWSRFWQLFTHSRMRNADLSAFLVMISQPLCGANIIFFMGTTVFQDAADNSNLKGYWMSFGIGLAGFLFVLLAWGTIDSKGRKYLLNRSFPFMAISLLAAGLSFTPDLYPGRTILVPFFLYLFVIAYSAGEGPVAFTLSAESFPLLNREQGMSFAVFWNMLANGVLALVTPQLAYALSYRGLLCIFAGINIILWILNYFFTRETSKVQLEGLNDVFQVENCDHIRYQIDSIKYQYDYYIRRRKDAPPPEPLWIWASAKKERKQTESESPDRLEHI
jgi:MFS family permease